MLDIRTHPTYKSTTNLRGHDINSRGYRRTRTRRRHRTLHHSRPEGYIFGNVPIVAASLILTIRGKTTVFVALLAFDFT